MTLDRLIAGLHDIRNRGVLGATEIKIKSRLGACSSISLEGACLGADDTGCYVLALPVTDGDEQKGKEKGSTAAVLTDRNLEIFYQRLCGQQLAAIGKRHKVTTERVRIIVERCFGRFRRAEKQWAAAELACKELARQLKEAREASEKANSAP